MSDQQLKAPVVFITRHYPPSPNINGEAVWDLVSYLEKERGLKSVVLTMDKKFHGLGGAERVPVGEIHLLKSINAGKNGLMRLLSLFYDGFVLMKAAKKYQDSIIVVTSSPPILPFWAAMMLKKSQRWFFWSLDLFPEGFAATGQISSKNPIYKFITLKTYSSHPSRLISLGPMQAAHLRKLFHQELPASILPCGVFFHLEKNNTPPAWYRNDRIVIGYCGNVHDPHNPEFIERVIDNINPGKHLLVLALYGTKAERVKAYAANKEGIIIMDNVPRSQLHFIDVHMVSLQTSWTHIAVPSKAVSAVSMGRPILFCGSEQSDNWQMFRDAGWFIQENDQIKESIENWFDQLTREEVDRRKQEAFRIYERLKKTVLNSYRELGDLFGK